MNSQKLENQREEKIDVNKRRRFLQKAGVVAPIILTFNSPTAFGANGLCLSQQLSGNQSRTVVGNCQAGLYSPSSLAPSQTNSSASGLSPLVQPASNFPSIGEYNQDTVFNSVFHSSMNTHSFGSILAESLESRESVYITAFMNAQASSSYILTSKQVIDLYDNPSNRPAGYVSDTAFLLSTFPQ